VCSPVEVGGGGGWLVNTTGKCRCAHLLRLVVVVAG